MKNIENIKALNDMAMEAVAGGDDDDWTVVDAFVECLLSPLNDAAGGTKRPLPFPQNRRNRDLTDLPCDDPFYTRDGSRQPVFSDYRMARG